MTVKADINPFLFEADANRMVGGLSELKTDMIEFRSTLRYHDDLPLSGICFNDSMLVTALSMGPATFKYHYSRKALLAALYEFHGAVKFYCDRKSPMLRITDGQIERFVHAGEDPKDIPDYYGDVQRALVAGKWTIKNGKLTIVNREKHIECEPGWLTATQWFELLGQS